MAKNYENLVTITAAHVSEVAQSLLERFGEDEKTQLMKMLIEKEALKKLQEFQKRGQELESTVEEFALQVEKRLLNKLVYQEAKLKVLSRH